LFTAAGVCDSDRGQGIGVERLLARPRWHLCCGPVCTHRQPSPYEAFAGRDAVAAAAGGARQLSTGWNYSLIASRCRGVARAVCPSCLGCFLPQFPRLGPTPFFPTSFRGLYALFIDYQEVGSTALMTSHVGRDSRVFLNASLD